MVRSRNACLMVYIEPLLKAVLVEGVLTQTPDLTESEYGRQLIYQDLESRGLLTPEIKDALYTGKPLQPRSAA